MSDSDSESDEDYVPPTDGKSGTRDSDSDAASEEEGDSDCSAEESGDGPSSSTSKRKKKASAAAAPPPKRLSLNSNQLETKSSAKPSSVTLSTPSASARPAFLPQRRPGLADRLSALTKKKEGVLAKSKSDWERMKKEEGLVEELSEHVKSKDSFVERQAFLQRADVRQFEQEKSVRDKIRARRLP